MALAVVWVMSVYKPGVLAQAAVTRYQQTGGFNKNAFAQSSGGWKSKISVLAGLVSEGNCLLGQQRATSVYVFMWSFLCVQAFLFLGGHLSYWLGAPPL